MFAAQIAKLSGTEDLGHQLSDVLSELGGVASAVGSAAVLFSGPVGGAILAVGAVLSASGQIIEGIEDGNPVEIVTGILTASVAAISLINSLKQKIKLTSDEKRKMQIFQAEQAIKIKQYAEYAQTFNCPLEEASPRTRYYIEEFNFEKAFGPGAKAAAANALQQGAMDSATQGGLGRALYKGSTRIPGHGKTVTTFPDVARVFEVKPIDPLTGREASLPGVFEPRLSRVVITGEVANVGGRIIGLDAIADANVPGRRGSATIARGVQFWDGDGATGRWRWSTNPGDYSGNDAVLSKAATLEPGEFTRFADQFFGVNPADVEKRMVLIKQAIPVVDFVLAETMFQRAAAGRGQHDFNSNNCQNFAKELYDMAAGNKLPTWMDRSDEASIQLEYINRIRGSVMSVNDINSLAARLQTQGYRPVPVPAFYPAGQIPI
jgi:hypothetical protein